MQSEVRRVSGGGIEIRYIYVLCGVKIHKSNI